MNYQNARAILTAALLAASSFCAHALPVVTSTLPQPGQESGATPVGAIGNWFDVAVGFQVESAGYVTQISTTLRNGGWAGDPFRVGIASNGLIGDQQSTYFQTPPASLWETSACSSAPRLGYDYTACTDANGVTIPGSGTPFGFMEYLTLDNLSVFLPQAGLYWFYTRAPFDGVVFNQWLGNSAIQTDLIALRTGFDSTCQSRPQDCTFSRVAQPQNALGLSVTFNALEVAEPTAASLLGIGLLSALWGQRRKLFAELPMEKSAFEG